MTCCASWSMVRDLKPSADNPTLAASSELSCLVMPNASVMDKIGLAPSQLCSSRPSVSATDLTNSDAWNNTLNLFIQQRRFDCLALLPWCATLWATLSDTTPCGAGLRQTTPLVEAMFPHSTSSCSSMSSVSPQQDSDHTELHSSAANDSGSTTVRHSTSPTRAHTFRTSTLRPMHVFTLTSKWACAVHHQKNHRCG